MKSSRHLLYLTASTAALATLTLAPIDAPAGPVAPGMSNLPLAGVSKSPSGRPAGELLARQARSPHINDPAASGWVVDGEIETMFVREPTGKLTFLHRLLGNKPVRPVLGEVFRLTTFNIEPHFETDIDYFADADGEGHPWQIPRGDNWSDYQFDGNEGILVPLSVKTNAVDFDTGGLAIGEALVSSVDAHSGNIHSGLFDGVYRPILIPLPPAIYTGVIGLTTVYIARRRMRPVPGRAIR